MNYDCNNLQVLKSGLIEFKKAISKSEIARYNEYLQPSTYDNKTYDSE